MKKILLSACAILIVGFASAQIVGAEAYMQHSYLEVGVNACGAYGTTGVAPGSYFTNTSVGSPFFTSSSIGFNADAGQNGYTIAGPGAFPAFCGDYFIPGSPVEGWSLTLNGIDYGNTDQFCNSVGSGSIPGSVTTYLSGAAADTVIWVGSIGGLTVTQMTILPTDSMYFITRMFLYNGTASTINGVYYGRNVDPDQDQPWGNDFTTTNTIVSQPSGMSTDALVTATGLTHSCFLGLGTRDSRARVNVGSFSTNPADDTYNGVMYNQTVGYTNTADEAIAIGFNLGNIAPGQTVCFAFAYILDVSKLGSALDATGVITIDADGTDITATGTAPICPGSTCTTISLSSGSVPYTYTWSPGTGLSTTTGSTVIACPAVTTTYTVTATPSGPNACGVISFPITVFVDNSTINAGPDVVICPPGTPSTTLTAVYSGLGGGVGCAPTYTVSSIPYAPLVPATTNSAGVNCDDCIGAAITLPFTFQFYCNSYTNVYPSSNGFLTFNSTSSSGCCSGMGIPNTSSPNDIVALFWNDLYPPGSPLGGANAVDWFITGAAPNRIFVLRFNQVPHCCGSTAPFQSGQIQLHETTNIIEIHIESHTDDGSTATAGVENSGGTVGTAPAGRAGVNWTTTNESWRFTPGTMGPTYTWTPVTGLSSTTTDTTTASPATTTTYTVCVFNGMCNVCDDVIVDVCPLNMTDINFNVIARDGSGFLSWNVVGEQDVRKYIVERSLNGADFLNIGDVASLGNTSGTNPYLFTDNGNLSGRQYYRIKIENVDGSIQYTEVKSINFDAQGLNVYPNPTSGLLNMELNLERSSEVQIELFNAVGQKIHSLMFNANAGTLVRSIDLGQLTAGVYSYTVKTAEGNYNGVVNIHR